MQNILDHLSIGVADLKDAQRFYDPVLATIGVNRLAVTDGFIAYGRGMVLFSAPVDDDRLYWVASIRLPEGTVQAWAHTEAQAQLRSRMERWDPSLRGVVEASDPTTWVHTDVHDRDPVDRWHRGRGVLLGDAAHPMVYTLGQGANMALEDAAVLAHGLATSDALEPALVAYAEARASRVARVTRMSRMLGKAAHLDSAVLRWLRNTMMRLTMSGGSGASSASSESSDPNDWLFGWSGPDATGGAA